MSAVPTRVDCAFYDLDGPIDADLAVLDAQERARADRFRFERHRRWFIRSHAALRRELAGRLGTAPEAVVLATTARGKPVLDGTPAIALHFNLSHSDALACIALGDAPLGIDVETWPHRLMHDVAGVDELIDTTCTADEAALLRATPATERPRRFLQLWTRKEACLKAWGTGIGAVPLDSVEVGWSAGRIAPTAAITALLAAAAPPSLWLTTRIEPDRIASLAVTTPTTPTVGWIARRGPPSPPR